MGGSVNLPSNDRLDRLISHFMKNIVDNFCNIMTDNVHFLEVPASTTRSSFICNQSSIHHADIFQNYYKFDVTLFHKLVFIYFCREEGSNRACGSSDK